MNGDYLMIHYGELSTKGENRKAFINQLARNVRHALKEFPTLTVTGDRDHSFVNLPEGVDPLPIIKKLQDVSGIQKISLVHKCSKDLEEIKKTALDLLSKEEGNNLC